MESQINELMAMTMTRKKKSQGTRRQHQVTECEVLVRDVVDGFSLLYECRLKSKPNIISARHDFI